MTRTFEDHKAERKEVPLLVGLAGPSSSGKTFSALRLARGMQEVTGGEVFGIDTESNRMLHYADRFDFRHVPFKPPFSPLDYQQAIEHCTERGAKIIIVDSASHEHEGKGGVLEWHEAELNRMAGNDQSRRNKLTFSAWAKPKAARRSLINTVLQLGVNAIFCFRAKQKLKIVKGRTDPIELGWMPIGGEEWVYEMTVNCLLYPNSGGIPTWSSEYAGERTMMKLPAQFHGVFSEEKPLDEKIGKHLAEWARGGETPEATGSKPAERTPQQRAWDAAKERAETIGGSSKEIMQAVASEWGLDSTAEINSGTEHDFKQVLEFIAHWEPGEDPAQ